MQVQLAIHQYKVGPTGILQPQAERQPLQQHSRLLLVLALTLTMS
jgi:hypothetical protein